jgi:hypothetical protein
MRVWAQCVSLLLAIVAGNLAFAQDSGALLEQARAAQAAGDYSKAKSTLFQAGKQFPNDVAVARAEARWLDASGDRGRRAAYKHLLDLLKQNGQSDPATARRLAMLDLEAGDLAAAKAAGVLKASGYQPFQPAVNGSPTIHIPGPVNSFRRLAAISSQTPQSDLVAIFSRNLFSLGFHYSQKLSKNAPTEYLTLVQHYVGVARQLEKMAGPDGVLKVTSCEQAGPLLQVLGYRLRKGGCGATAVLETEDSPLAFLTIDSGFPLAELEDSFRTGKPFTYDVRGVDVPLLFGTAAWFDAKSDPLDQLLEGREISRLYYAMSKMDSRTADALRASPGIPKLLDVGPVLDFYGESLLIENGRPVMPGGTERLDQWAKLVGVDPAKPADFLFALVDKDNGWLAAYADSLQQLDAQQQAYYFSNGRLERFYAALRGSSNNYNNGAARPVFRPNAELLLLPQRMRLGPDGRPLIPGGPPTWKSLFAQALPKNAPKNSAPKVDDADDVIAAQYSKIRTYEENGLLNVFVALNEMDRRREHPLEPATVQALAHEYGRFSHHYSLFSDWPEISDASINKFLKACDNIIKMKQPVAKADALGMLQASVGLWEILARQAEIPEKDLGSSFDTLIAPFTGNLEKPPFAVFDAGSAAVETLLAAAGAANVHPVTSARSSGAGGVQDTLLKLLAGPAPAANDIDSKRAHDYISATLRAALESQRLVRLDALMGLADMLKDGGHPPSPDAVLRLAGQLREFKVPMVYVSAAERNAAFPGFWTEKHLDQERDVDVPGLVEKKKRELLTPFLRDTLVGLNYAYYAPPGAQILFHNPLFVRSHDFMGRNGLGTGNEIWGPGKVSGTGWPLSGGGRLVGALSGLPYGLAEAEQDFLIPSNTQALIWSDLAPQMVISAVIPRWWTATVRQQRWVADHQRLGEDLVAEAAVSPETRDRVMALMRAHIEPHRREEFLQDVSLGRVDAALTMLTPAELLRLSRRWMAAGNPAIDSPVYGELLQMKAAASPDFSDAVISRLFGVPRPKLSRSWRPELLGMGLLPALQGYSSRLMAESWESNNLEWARLADELNLPPASLSWLAPELTQKMLEHIFANHHEDWPAILRALRATTEEYRRSTIPSGGKSAE